jgi:hypothetical protein
MTNDRFVCLAVAREADDNYDGEALSAKFDFCTESLDFGLSI